MIFLSFRYISLNVQWRSFKGAWSWIAWSVVQLKNVHIFISLDSVPDPRVLLVNLYYSIVATASIIPIMSDHIATGCCIMILLVWLARLWCYPSTGKGAISHHTWHLLNGQGSIHHQQMAVFVDSLDQKVAANSKFSSYPWSLGPFLTLYKVMKPQYISR